MKALALFGALLMLCAMCLSATAATDEQIQAAIDTGLVWLAAQQDPGTGAFGTDRPVAKTGLAVKKFEHDAILRGYDSPFDPDYMYHEVVEDGFDYIFQYAVIVPITDQPAGNPDTDGDGIGVAFWDPGSTYETGICLMAIAESTTPDREVGPGSAVTGWTYQQVAIDVMNWLAWVQVDAPHAWRGGWRYGAGYTTADQSNSGYATLGLAFFEAPPPSGFGLPVAPFVKPEMGDPGLWVDWIQNDVGVGDPQYDGGSGYDHPDGVVNTLETGNLLFEMAWYGDGVGTQRVQEAIDYIVRAWNLAGAPTPPATDWENYQGWLGNYQAMFTMMKGLEALQIDMIDSIDWFDEVSTYIVTNQNGDGSWGPDFWDWWAGNDGILTTSWALLTLQKVTIPPPYMLDIKPTSCPNPINVNSKGVLPVAVLGGENADVTEIDVASLELEGVPPIRWAYADVATPVPEDADTCECTTEGPDGYLDLTLKFENELIVAAIAPVVDGEVRILTLSGQTLDGLGFEAYDCVRVLDKRKGIEVMLGEVDQPGKGQAITEISLGGGHPNPFRSEVSVAYSLPSESRVSLTIYHVSGKRVRTLVDDVVPAGHHSVLWDGRDAFGADVATGVYFCRMTADGLETSTKLVRIE